MRRHAPRGLIARFTLGICLVVAPAAGLLSATPAAAASPVTATGGSCAGGGALGWTTATQTVTAGTSITFSNCQTPQATPGNHGLGASWTGLCNPSTTDWRVITPQSTVCTFANPGQYAFVCTVHGSAMAGSITVQSAPSTSPPPTTSPAPGQQGARSTSPGAPAAGYGPNSGLPRDDAGAGPAPLVIGLVVVVAVAIGVVYFLRTRKPANPAP